MEKETGFLTVPFETFERFKEHCTKKGYIMKSKLTQLIEDYLKEELDGKKRIKSG